MTTVWTIPAGTDTAPGAASGDFLLRPSGDLVEVGKMGESCTWIGTMKADLLPALPSGDDVQKVGDQVAALKAVEGLEVAEDLRGG